MSINFSKNKFLKLISSLIFYRITFQNVLLKRALYRNNVLNPRNADILMMASASISLPSVCVTILKS